MKTAVKELIEKIESFGFILHDDTKKEFFEKEKEQIIDAYEKDMSSNGNLSFESGLEYYNETYEIKKSN